MPIKVFLGCASVVESGFERWEATQSPIIESINIGCSDAKVALVVYHQHPLVPIESQSELERVHDDCPVTVS